MREASNGEEAARAIAEASGVPVDILSDEEEGRLSFIGATKGLGHPVEGKIGVVDVGGGSTEVIIGTVPGGVEKVRSWRVGSGVLADELIASDPPSAAEIRKVRDRIDDIFEGVEIEHPAQAVAVGGSATSLRRLVGTVLEYETLERGIRVLCGDPAADVARRFELDPVRSASSPPACCSWRRSPSCSASRCRSARVGSARASSSTSSTATPTAPLQHASPPGCQLLTPGGPVAPSRSGNLGCPQRTQLATGVTEGRHGSSQLVSRLFTSSSCSWRIRWETRQREGDTDDFPS